MDRLRVSATISVRLHFGLLVRDCWEWRCRNGVLAVGSHTRRQFKVNPFSTLRLHVA